MNDEVIVALEDVSCFLADSSNRLLRASLIPRGRVLQLDGNDSQGEGRCRVLKGEAEVPWLVHGKKRIARPLITGKLFWRPPRVK